MVADGEGIQNCAEGFPFPIPQNAQELIWNHKLKYKGLSVVSFSNQTAPTAGGAFTLVKLREEILGLYYKPGNTTENINNILLYFKQEVLGPARLAGQVLLVHETLNAKAAPRQAWVYNPGQRRVRRAPNVAYDNPGTASDGLRTNDMTWTRTAARSCSPTITTARATCGATRTPRPSTTTKCRRSGPPSRPTTI